MEARDQSANLLSPEVEVRQNWRAGECEAEVDVREYVSRNRRNQSWMCSAKNCVAPRSTGSRRVLSRGASQLRRLVLPDLLSLAHRIFPPRAAPPVDTDTPRLKEVLTAPGSLGSALGLLELPRSAACPRACEESRAYLSRVLRVEDESGPTHEDAGTHARDSAAQCAGAA